MTDDAFEAALSRLIAEEALPDSYRDIAATHWLRIADAIAAKRAEAGRPILVGVNGPQGSGKSTLARVLSELLPPRLGLSCAVLALDDLYLTRAERSALARAAHPLFATRGPPGTHDLALGIALVDALLHGPGPARLPRFDKGRDDRAPDARTVDCPVDVLLLEGWCVGASAQAEEELPRPVNDLEAREDGDARWRRAVNDALAGPYQALFARIDFLVMLRPASFEAVIANRQAQERKLRARTGRGMDEASVVRFVSHYERLTRHMLARLPDSADALVDLGDDQAVTRLRIGRADAPARR